MHVRHTAATKLTTLSRSIAIRTTNVTCRPEDAAAGNAGVGSTEDPAWEHRQPQTPTVQCRASLMCGNLDSSERRGALGTADVKSVPVIAAIKAKLANLKGKIEAQAAS
ncbi:hypothetical protein AOLI_G00189920 [Acnodon oligacanthus]